MTVRNPLLAPALALAAGIVVAHLGGLDVRECTLTLAGAAGLTAVAWLRARRLEAACTLFCFFSAGAALMPWNRPGPPPQLNVEFGEEAVLEGCIVEPPALLESREQFVLEL